MYNLFMITYFSIHLFCFTRQIICQLNRIINRVMTINDYSPVYFKLCLNNIEKLEYA